MIAVARDRYTAEADPCAPLWEYLTPWAQQAWIDHVGTERADERRRQ